MSAPAPTTATPAGALPPILEAEDHAPIIPRRGWFWTIAPAYAGVFVAFPILDRLGVGLGQAVAGGASLPEALGWTLAPAVLAVLACDALLYDPLGLWGWSSGRRLAVTAASAFGTRGSEWLTGVLVAFGAIVAYAVALHMALRLVFLGLVACGLVDAASLEPWTLGSLTIESPVFLVTAAFWIFITGMTALLRIPSVIFALMQVYTPVALLLLAVTAGLVGGVAPEDLQTAGSLASTPIPPAQVVQLLFGAFALSGLFAVEWGMTVERRSDVRIGGWVGVLAAGSFAAAMALIAVARAVGAPGSGASPTVPGADGLTSPFSLHWAILHGVGGRTGGTILMLFGLASLAPACYTIWVYSRRLRDHWPFLSRWRWTWVGSLPAFVLVATSWAGRLEIVFGLMGAVFAPMAGVLAADATYERFRWRGIREGWNPPGLIAWAGGLAAGLGLRNRVEPAALLAYLVAAAIYLALGVLLPVSPHRELPTAPARDGSAGP